MKLKALALAALAAVVSMVSPAPARALECDQLTAGLQICLPRYGTDFDQWAQSDINALTLLNGSATVAGSSITAPRIWVSTISGLTNSGIYISSYSVFGSSGLSMGHWHFLSSTTFASIATFTASGASTYSIGTASGISLGGGPIRFPDGTLQFSAATTFSGTAADLRATNSLTSNGPFTTSAGSVTIRAASDVAQIFLQQDNNVLYGWKFHADSSLGYLSLIRRDNGSDTTWFKFTDAGGFGAVSLTCGSCTVKGNLSALGSFNVTSTSTFGGGIGAPVVTVSSLNVTGAAVISGSLTSSTLTLRALTDIAQIFLVQDNNVTYGWKLHGDSSLGYLAFIRRDAGVDTTRLRLTDTGRLGVNDETPDATLEALPTSIDQFIVQASSHNDTLAGGIDKFGHLVSSTTNPPSIGTCANGALQVPSTDFSGRINFSGVNTSCSITFAFPAQPGQIVNCQVSSHMATPALVDVQASGTTLTLTATAFANTDYSMYSCTRVGGSY